MPAGIPSCLIDNITKTQVIDVLFYADTCIITTYYLNNTSVTCIFSYVIYVAKAWGSVVVKALHY